MALLSILICAIFLAKLEKEQGSFLNIFYKLIGVFLIQGSKGFKVAENFRFGSFILLFFCLFFTNILTKCFTSLLLGTFFKTKPSLTVETLEDIASNPEINIIGRDSIEELKHFNPGIYEIIHKRNIDYEKQLNVIEKKEKVIYKMSKVIKDVSQRRTVILTNSLNAKSLKIFMHLNNLMESEHKYSQNFIYSYVSKSLTNYRQIYRM